jgi:hypothetical protein
VPQLLTQNSSYSYSYSGSGRRRRRQLLFSPISSQSLPILINSPTCNSSLSFYVRHGTNNENLRLVSEKFPISTPTKLSSDVTCIKKTTKPNQTNPANPANPANQTKRKGSDYDFICAERKYCLSSTRELSPSNLPRFIYRKKRGEFRNRNRERTGTGKGSQKRYLPTSNKVNCISADLRIGSY